MNILTGQQSLVLNSPTVTQTDYGQPEFSIPVDIYGVQIGMYLYNQTNGLSVRGQFRFEIGLIGMLVPNDVFPGNIVIANPLGVNGGKFIIHGEKEAIYMPMRLRRVNGLDLSFSIILEAVPATTTRCIFNYAFYYKPSDDVDNLLQ